MTKQEIYSYFYKLGSDLAKRDIDDADTLVDALSFMTDDQASNPDSDVSSSKPSTVLDTTGERQSRATWGDKIELFTEGNTGVNVR
jgi:hypothetical protein